MKFEPSAKLWSGNRYDAFLPWLDVAVSINPQHQVRGRFSITFRNRKVPQMVELRPLDGLSQEGELQHMQIVIAFDHQHFDPIAVE